VKTESQTPPKKESKDKDRLLPWETSPPKASKTHQTVWSSSDDDPLKQAKRDRE
jgi:hypothetical protein